MTTQEDIVKCAKTYLETPYHHQGRVKGEGVDCCGLLLCVAHELGLSDYDLDGYSRFGDGFSFMMEFSKICGEPVKTLIAGNLVVIKVGRYPHHCGILSILDGRLSLIHAYQSLGKVVEHNLDESWCNRIVASFKFPNVD